MTQRLRDHAAPLRVPIRLHSPYCESTGPIVEEGFVAARVRALQGLSRQAWVAPRSRSPQALRPLNSQFLSAEAHNASDRPTPLKNYQRRFLALGASLPSSKIEDAQQVKGADSGNRPRNTLGFTTSSKWALDCTETAHNTKSKDLPSCSTQVKPFIGAGRPSRLLTNVINAASTKVGTPFEHEAPLASRKPQHAVQVETQNSGLEWEGEHLVADSASFQSESDKYEQIPVSRKSVADRLGDMANKGWEAPYAHSAEPSTATLGFGPFNYPAYQDEEEWTTHDSAPQEHSRSFERLTERTGLTRPHSLTEMPLSFQNGCESPTYYHRSKVERQISNGAPNQSVRSRNSIDFDNCSVSHAREFPTLLGVQVADPRSERRHRTRYNDHSYNDKSLPARQHSTAEAAQFLKYTPSKEQSHSESLPAVSVAYELQPSGADMTREVTVSDVVAAQKKFRWWRLFLADKQFVAKKSQSLPCIAAKHDNEMDAENVAEHAIQEEEPAKGRPDHTTTDSGHEDGADDEHNSMPTTNMSTSSHAVLIGTLDPTTNVERRRNPESAVRSLVRDIEATSAAPGVRTNVLPCEPRDSGHGQTRGRGERIREIKVIVSLE
ncbi:hypothetical protein MMC12_005487 [Toensbergia leucococca]|nr:hypothetical protein [Toensbergia leucococca]